MCHAHTSRRAIHERQHAQVLVRVHTRRGTVRGRTHPGRRHPLQSATCTGTVSPSSAVVVDESAADAASSRDGSRPRKPRQESPRTRRRCHREAAVRWCGKLGRAAVAREAHVRGAAVAAKDSAHFARQNGQRASVMRGCRERGKFSAACSRGSPRSRSGARARYRSVQIE